MKICIARLRSHVQYIEPLHHIVDSFFEVLKTFMMRNPQHQYFFYNCSFDGSKPVRDLKALEQSDVIIIPSEAEFTYHIPYYFHSMELKKSNAYVAETIPYVAGKKVIVLRSDRADNEELYKKLLGQNINYQEIDEDDFPGNIHSLKFNFIRSKIGCFSVREDKVYDFVYWGGDKRKDITGKVSGDERHKILKKIRDDKEYSTFMIGRFYNISRDMKMSKMKDIIEILSLGKYTICFNWKSNTATTARYIEALACGIVPLVYKDYDSLGKFGTQQWQRIQDHIDFGLVTLGSDYFRNYTDVLDRYISIKMPDTFYHDMFEHILKSKLEC